MHCEHLYCRYGDSSALRSSHLNLNPESPVVLHPLEDDAEKLLGLFRESFFFGVSRWSQLQKDTTQDLDHAKDSNPALSCNKRQNISYCKTVLGIIAYDS